MCIRYDELQQNFDNHAATTMDTKQSVLGTFEDSCATLMMSYGFFLEKTTMLNFGLSFPCFSL